MKKTLVALAGTVLIASSLAACAEGGGIGISNEGLGNVAGGVAGGVLGSQFGKGKGQIVTGVAGALLGAWAGGKIVQGMTAQDRGYYESAANQAYSAPSGQTITWANPQSGATGTITPGRTGVNNATGETCREYQQTITVGGRSERAYGQACRQADGSWRIVS